MLAAAAEEGESMMAAELRCTVCDCVCSWSSYCSTRIPRVGPGRDYLHIPADAVHAPAWSLLVGVTDGAVLRLKRLRVARSGRILGRSDDKLDPFRNIKTPTEPEFNASAALASDGRSLCVLCQAAGEQPHARRLTLHPPTHTEGIPSELPLPEIEETSRCVPISAAGHIWALYATVQHHIKSFSVNMLRLLPEGRWEQVGHTFTSPFIQNEDSRWDGEFLQGHAVLPDANLILVSFKQSGLFCTFALDSGNWTLVLTERNPRNYVPILGRGVYVEQEGAVYMLRDNTIYAYKVTYDQGTEQLRLALPTTVDSISPFNSCRGYGLLSRLEGQLMCSVWISLAWREPCPCDYLHAIVTTFHLKPALGGIEVLHSSFRRIDMEPNPGDQQFCFLQEYEDKDYPLPLQEDLATSQHVDEPLKMLNCCRWILYPDSMQHKVHFPSRPVIHTKPATITIKKDLFILWQSGTKPVIYQTSVVDESLRLEGDDGEPLQPSYVGDDSDDYWHFFHSGSNVHAVSCKRDGMLEFSLNKDRRTIIRRPVRRPSADTFVVVIRVGGNTIALTETLQVFHQGSKTGPPMWFRYKTDQSHVLFRKVLISGYAAVKDDSFIVYDAVTCSCLLFELGLKQWRVVMPWAAFEDGMPRTSATNCGLKGRCVFVDDFIYTCRDGGLAAYELLRKDHSVYLSKQIFLPFSWHTDCVGDEMCLDYAGKDEKSASILFYVVQGGYSPPKHDVHITIVQVKTKRTPSNGRKPVGVDCVDSVKRVIHHGETMHARCCFAVS
ncbi:unnamed protein product [Alopecurus aequalis]